MGVQLPDTTTAVTPDDAPLKADAAVAVEKFDMENGSGNGNIAKKGELQVGDTTSTKDEMAAAANEGEKTADEENGKSKDNAEDDDDVDDEDFQAAPNDEEGDKAIDLSLIHI